jgi:DNA repair protein RAD5
MTISLIVANQGRGGDTLTDLSRPAGEIHNGGLGEAGTSSPLRDDNAPDAVNLNDDASPLGGEDDTRLQSHKQASTTATPPLESKRKRARRGGGTLIVCPMTLLSQWKAEVETHVKPGTLSVYCYYGSDRAREKRTLLGQDVVITTYGTLASECNHDSFLEEGPIHSIHWLRVVLDEAHSIKGSKTQSAKGVFHLTADRRWCLTGTPIQNKLEDIFSLLHFLRWGSCCRCSPLGFYFFGLFLSDAGI